MDCLFASGRVSSFKVLISGARRRMRPRGERARQARDALGRTPLETAMARGAIPDVELFMLLSEAE